MYAEGNVKNIDEYLVRLIVYVFAYIFIPRFCVLYVPLQAYIVTLLSKLDVQETSCKLSVCIDDGSAVTSCNIASHVSQNKHLPSSTTRGRLGWWGREKGHMHQNFQFQIILPTPSCDPFW